MRKCSEQSTEHRAHAGPQLTQATATVLLQGRGRGRGRASLSPCAPPQAPPAAGAARCGRRACSSWGLPWWAGSWLHTSGCCTPMRCDNYKVLWPREPRPARVPAASAAPAPCARFPAVRGLAPLRPGRPTPGRPCSVGGWPPPISTCCLHTLRAQAHAGVGRELEGGLRLFLSEELAPFNGQRSKRIYLGIMGRVFDVTAGARHYGAGGAPGLGRCVGRGSAGRHAMPLGEEDVVLGRSALQTKAGGAAATAATASRPGLASRGSEHGG